jgi:hypothetical protein
MQDASVVTPKAIWPCGMEALMIKEVFPVQIVIAFTPALTKAGQRPPRRRCAPGVITR